MRLRLSKNINDYDYDKTIKSKTKDITTRSSGGIGFCGMLAIVFITLKLAQIGPVATWSWWWVLSPLWIPFTFLLVIMFIGIMIGIIFNYLK